MNMSKQKRNNIRNTRLHLDVVNGWLNMIFSLIKPNRNCYLRV